MVKIFSLLFIIIIFISVKEKYYREKFQSTPLNISIADLKKDWGTPDYELIPANENDNRVIKYNNIFGQYVFVSDERDSLIVRKTVDD